MALIGIPANPIIAAVIISGTKLGSSDTKTILQERNKKDIKIAITKMAIARLINRFLTK